MPLSIDTYSTVSEAVAALAVELHAIWEAERLSFAPPTKAICRSIRWSEFPIPSSAELRFRRSGAPWGIRDHGKHRKTSGHGCDFFGGALDWRPGICNMATVGGKSVRAEPLRRLLPSPCWRSARRWRPKLS